MAKMLAQATLKGIVGCILLLLASNAFAASGTQADSPASGSDQPRTMAADTPSATGGGTTFTVRAGWTIATRGSFIVLSPPEGDLQIALTDSQAPDAETAVASAWREFEPGFKRPLQLSEPLLAEDGWEKIQHFEYKVSPNEKRIVRAFARRANHRWLVVIYQGGLATREKRVSEIEFVLGSLRPQGYQRESFAGKTARPIDAHAIRALKDFLARGMKKLDIPGVAFGIIDHGKIVYVGGLGVRELDKPDLVDADTRFIAASDTKALTTLLLAELVDEKKLRWDEPVTEAYPSFKFGDAKVTRDVLIKHLACQCTGMPAQNYDSEFRNRSMTPTALIRFLGTMQPVAPFGKVFIYSDMLPAAAGFIAGSIAEPGKEPGAAYDDAMQKKVLDPLGMTRSTFDFAKAMQGNYARPHFTDVDGNLVVSPMTYTQSYGARRPAGGLWTSAHDLSQYVMMELSGGVLPNGRRLVSKAGLLQRRMPNVAIAADEHYGMGLVIDTHWGVTVVNHSGGRPGYASYMMWLPDYGIGAVILTNSDNGGLLIDAFARKLVEQVFDGAPEADRQLQAAAMQDEIDARAFRQSLQIPADRLSGNHLAARYHNDALGDLVVSRSGKNLDFRFDEWHSMVASRANGDGSTTFVTLGEDMPFTGFLAGERSGKRTLTLVDGERDYSFVERNDM
jgi:CubicO group peptidase (beta-lactamase class C family)